MYDLKAPNILDLIEGLELEIKIHEIKQIKQNKNIQLVYLYKTKNILTKKATIKGIYFIVNEITDGFYELSNYRCTELIVVKSFWFRKV